MRGRTRTQTIGKEEEDEEDKTGRRQRIPMTGRYVCDGQREGGAVTGPGGCDGMRGRTSQGPDNGLYSTPASTSTSSPPPHT